MRRRVAPLLESYVPPEDREAIANNYSPFLVGILGVGPSLSSAWQVSQIFMSAPPPVLHSGRASAAGHRPNRQPSTLTLNWRSWAGRLHAVLGRALLDATLHEEGAILHVCVEDVVYPPVAHELEKLCGHGLLVNGCRLAKFYDLDAVFLVLHFVTG